jgi:preprotein translocase subunit SecY
MASIGELFEVPDLRRRIGYTLGALAIFRVGASIPIPGVNSDAIKAIFNAQSGNLLGFLNTFSGGALGRFSIFSMGVMPYINASIIVSLLQGAHVFPVLDRLANEGELGRRKLNNYTRYLTLFLAIFQSFGLTLAITKMPVPGGISVVPNPDAFFYCVTVLTLTAGTIFVMWLGEQITEIGIGNGVSLIIFAGIVERLPVGRDEPVRARAPRGDRRVHRDRDRGRPARRHDRGRLGRDGSAQDPRPIREARRGPAHVRRRPELPAAEGRPVGRHRGHLRGLAARGPDDGVPVLPAKPHRLRK